MPSIPEQTGTTAVVHDFICLFTHDLKRKQKRWQDGKLKYHCFNKKLMVYDERGNFIGESHWRDDGDLQDECELTLERGGALVQVAECVGSHTQDLTDLVEKRARDVEARRASKAGRAGLGNSSTASTPQAPRYAPVHAHHVQRPLSSLVASPGPIGRAVVPAVSPYEARIADRGLYKVADSKPPSKRQRSASPPGKMGHARALFGTQLTLSATTINLSQARRKVLSQRTANVPSSTSNPELMCDKDMRPLLVQPKPPDYDVAEEQSKRVEPPVEVVAQALTRQIILDDTPESEIATKAGSERRTVSERMLLETASKDPRPGLLPLHANSIRQTSAAPRRKVVPNSHAQEHKSKRPISPSLEAEAVAKRQHVEGETCKDAHLLSSTTLPLVSQLPIRAEVVDLTEDTTSTVAAPIMSKTSVAAEQPEEGQPYIMRVQTKDQRSAKRQTEAGRETESNGRKAAFEVSKTTSKLHPERRKEEPRTELRIRPRQRRGLLMVSERANKDFSGSDQRIGPESGAKVPKNGYGMPVTPDETPSWGEEEESASLKPRNKTIVEEQDKGFEEWLEADMVASASKLSPSRTNSDPSKSSSKTKAKRKTAPKVEEVAKREKRRDTVSTGEETLVERTTRKQGPRIERLARKSVRSKEIIGFVPEPGIHLQMPFTNHAIDATKSIDFTSVSDQLFPQAVDYVREHSLETVESKLANVNFSARQDTPEVGIASFVLCDAGLSLRESAPRATDHVGQTMSLESTCDDQARNASDSKGVSAVVTASIQKAAQILQGSPQSRSSQCPDERPMQQARGRESGPAEVVRTSSFPAMEQQLQREALPNVTVAALVQNSIANGQSASPEAPVVADEEAVSSRQSSIDPHPNPTDLSSSSNARKTNSGRQISNPATRGRKAAAKKDAAGMAPRTMVQLDPPRPVFVRKLPTTASANAITTTGIGHAVVQKNLTSEFATANGGAWSKHAGDLLGMSRPEKGIRR